MGGSVNHEAADEQPDVEEQALADAVLLYLQEHPSAMDTLSGIADWWIRRQRIRVDVVRLARVLGRLVDRGVLERLESGEECRYRMRKV
jgi:hypothetical protein